MKTVDVKRLLAFILVGMMILSTCSIYARVSGIDLEETGDAMPGTIGMLNPYLNGQALTIYKNESDAGHQQPQIIYGSFLINGQRVTRSLYCIDFAKGLRSGSDFTEQADYQRLNDEQKKAISYVLGRTQILDAPRNAEGGFDNTGNLTAWQEYMATQLLIWYYINQYYTPGSCEGIGWYGVERACADGYANLEYCIMVRNYVDGIYRLPSFAGAVSEEAPSYEMQYSGVDNVYKTVLTDMNGVLERFAFQNTNVMTYTKKENQLSLQFTGTTAERNEIVACGAFTPQVGNVTYVTGRDDSIQPLLRCDGVLTGSPIDAYLKLYTNPRGGIRVYKQAVTDMTTMYSMQGAVYGVFRTREDAAKNVNPLAAIRINQKDTSGKDYGEVYGLPYGTYYVCETEGPQDASGQAVGQWELDKNIYTAKVQEGYDAVLNVGRPATVASKEQNYTASIRINKTSAQPAIKKASSTMAGAVYGIYKSRSAAENAKTKYADSSAAQLGAKQEGAEAVVVIKKTSDGIYGQADGLPLGIYYIKEVYAPEGWILDDEIYKADVRKPNPETFITAKTLTSSEMPEYGIIFVGKSRKENLFDAVSGSFDIGNAGTMAGAEYGVFRTREEAENAQIKEWKDTSAYSDNRVTTIVADQAGTTILGGPDLSEYKVYGISEALPKGTYYIVETKAPEGWLLDKQIYKKTTSKKLTDADGVYYALVSSQEIECSGAVEIYKTDAAGEERIADATLKGAKYGIYIQRTNAAASLKKVEGAEIITNEQGYGYIEGLPQGFYYIKEEAAPAGYQLDETLYPVEITSELITGVNPVVRIDSREAPILTDYIIQKYTVEDCGGATEPTPLPECTFGLYLESELDMTKLTRDADGNLNIELTYDEAGNILTKGTILEGKEPYYTAVTGKDGRAAFKNCYQGKYLVVELKIGSRKDGSTYRAITPYEITLPISDGQGGYRTEADAELIDEFAGAYLKIWKLDKKTGETITKKAVFQIYDYDLKKYRKLSVNGTLSDTFETDENGCITLDNRLGIGHYRLEEIDAPEGYERKNIEMKVKDGYVEYRELGEDLNLSDEWIRSETVEENSIAMQLVRVEDNPYQIRVEKVNENGERLTGATLAIVYANGNKPALTKDGEYAILQLAESQNEKKTSDENNRFEMVAATWQSGEEVKVWEYIPRGEYFLVELKAPEGYEIAEPIPFTVGDEIKTVVKNGVSEQLNEKAQLLTMTDRKLAGRVVVAKTGAVLTGVTEEETEFGTLYRLQYEQRPAAGVTFTVFREKTGEAVCSFTTTTDEITYSPEFALREDEAYYIMETAVPAGMVMSTRRYPCEMIYDEESGQYITELIRIENQLAEAEVRIYKQGEAADDFSKEEIRFKSVGIPDTYFGIYLAEGLCKEAAFEETVLNEGEKEILAADSLVGIGITDADGCAIINGKLPAGSYYWKELKPAEGYIMDEDRYPFEITYPLDNKEVVTVFSLNETTPLYNRLYKAKVVLNKKGTDGKHLSGVVFGLYQGRRKLGEYTTDENGRLSISNLPYGEYYFREVKGLVGYLFNTEQQYAFTVDAKTNQVIELTVVNEQINIPVTGDSVLALSGVALLAISLLGFGIVNGIRFFDRKRRKRP